MWNLDARNKNAITVFSVLSSSREQCLQQETLDREKRSKSSDSMDSKRLARARKGRSLGSQS